MTISEKVKSKIVEDCNSFYKSNGTFNEISVKKNAPSLHQRIKKYYTEFPCLLKEIPNLPPDKGTRVKNYNNTELLNKHFPGKIFLSGIEDKSFPVAYLRDEILDFLMISEDTETHTSKEGIVSFYLPGFNRWVIVLEDRFRGEHYNKSKYAYNKYTKDFRGLVKKYKDPIVIQLFSEIISEESVKCQLSSQGINLYNDFYFLSVDPPTKRHLGYSVMKYNNGKVKIVESGTHYVDNSFSRQYQILDMYNFIDSLFRDYDCKYFVSESAYGFGQENVRTLLCENVGVFQFIAEYNSISFVTVSPKRFKLYVIGDDKAGKEETIEWSKKTFDLIGDVEEHEADAIAIGIAFLSDRELIDLYEFR